MPALVFYPGILLPVVSPLIGGTNLVSAGAVSTFNVLETITTTATSSWNTRAIVGPSVTSTFNTRGNVIVITPFQASGYLPRPVPWPIDYARLIPSYTWNVYDLVQSSKLSSFAVVQTRNAQKLSTFNVSSSNVHGSVSSSFNLRSLVQAGPLNGSAWNVKKTVTPAKSVRFNTRISAVVQQLSGFNTNGILVTPNVTSTWYTKQQVTPSVQSTWKTYGRRFSSKLSEFNTLYALSTSETTRFKVLNPVAAQSVTSAWNLKKQVIPSISSRWNTRELTFAASSIMAWNTHKAVTPSKLSYFRVGINPNGQVTPSVQIAFNVRSVVIASKLASWITVGHTGYSVTSWFNTRSQVTASMNSAFNIGPGVNSHIRQLAQERIDFIY